MTRSSLSSGFKVIDSIRSIVCFLAFGPCTYGGVGKGLVIFFCCRPDFYGMVSCLGDAIVAFAWQHCVWATSSRHLRDGTVLGRCHPNFCGAALCSSCVVLIFAGWHYAQANMVVNSDWRTDYQNVPYQYYTIKRHLMCVIMFELERLKPYTVATFMSSRSHQVASGIDNMIQQY